jgi:hypothetical protein
MGEPLDGRQTLMKLTGRQSLFSVPPHERAIAEGKDRRTFYPALRVSRSGVTDYQAFLKQFQTTSSWQEFVVEPMMLGAFDGDKFPDIRHVMHTVLERPPGFFGSPDWRILYLPLMNG